MGIKAIFGFAEIKIAFIKTPTQAFLKGDRFSRVCPFCLVSLAGGKEIQINKALM